MNSDDFRRALHEDAAHQPPIAPDFRAAVSHQVRRQRLRAALVASPAIVVLLLAAALLLPRGGQDSTLQVADGGSAGTAVGTTVVPVPTTDATATTTAVPGETSTDATDPAPSTAPTVTGRAAYVSCGTVDIKNLDLKSLDTKLETAPLGCFMKAFNANSAADLTIVVGGLPGGGELTERVTVTADHTVTVRADGTMTVQLPAFNFGGGQGGAYSGDDKGGDCGTITIDMADKNSAAKPDARVGQCLAGAFAGSGSAHLAVVMHDAHGGTMTATIDVSTDHVLSISLNGTNTVKLPDHLDVPEDVLNAIPSGSMGLNGIMDLGNLRAGKNPTKPNG